MAFSMIDRDCHQARYRKDRNKWTLVTGTMHPVLDATQRAALKAGVTAGKVEIRTVPSRQMFIGGIPVGAPFE
jgi:hypothetical protein